VKKVNTFTSPGQTQAASVVRGDINASILTYSAVFPRYFFDLIPREVYTVIITLEIDLEYKSPLLKRPKLTWSLLQLAILRYREKS